MTLFAGIAWGWVALAVNTLDGTQYGRQQPDRPSRYLWVCLLATAAFTRGNCRLLQEKKNYAKITPFAFIELTANQLTYLEAIHLNVPVPLTVLQYSAQYYSPVCMCRKNRTTPTASEVMSVSLNSGNVHLATHGQLNQRASPLGALLGHLWWLHVRHLYHASD